jgi:hypothetical protein
MSSVAAPATVADYVRRLAELCDLRDWHIDVAVGGVGEDELATCEATYGQRRAKITLTETWEKLSAEDLRSTVVHELIHCHLGPLDHMVSQLAMAGLDETTAKVFEAAYTHQVEYATDALSLVLARSFPLPTFVTPEAV